MAGNYGEQAAAVLESLLATGQPKPDEILVVGCSSSEVMGGRIGKFSNEETGAEIETASDGLEAVNKVSASPEGYYDFIIMDIQMPVMDGLEATRQIRLLDRQDTKDLPIVAMSANAFAEDVRLSLEAGMNEHIAKPIEIDRLYSVMGKWFR